MAARFKEQAACLLSLRVRIPPGTWIFVSCECCVLLQVEASSTSQSLVQGSPTECVCVIVCDLETSTIRRRRLQLPFLSSVNRAALLRGKEKKGEGENEYRTELNYGLACIYIKC